VLAFEPLPENFELVEKSVNDNGFDNVTVSPLALSNVDGEAILHAPGPDNSALASLAAGRTFERVVPVQCTRLDALLGDDPRRRVDLMKVDVVGFEPEVLEGAIHTLAHDQPMVLFEVNDLVPSAEGVSARSIDLLRSHGYEMYGVEALGGPRWRLVPVGIGEDPSRFRDRWENDEYPPTLLAAHPDKRGTRGCLERLHVRAASTGS
jgi:FkbM family methyltransferase